VLEDSCQLFDVHLVTRCEKRVCLAPGACVCVCVCACVRVCVCEREDLRELIGVHALHSSGVKESSCLCL